LQMTPPYISIMYENFMDFIKWFSSQPHKLKIFIAGNHDIVLDANLVGLEMKNKILSQLPPDVIYLENSVININIPIIQGPCKKLRIYGIPNGASHGPAFPNILYDKMYQKAHILITHTPPFGILDIAANGRHAGSEKLAEYIKTFQGLHIFGHIHESHGVYNQKNTLFVNASIPFPKLNQPVRVCINL